jgi:hypothetical protein
MIKYVLILLILTSCANLPKKGDCFYLISYDINYSYGGIRNAPTIQVHSYSKNKKDMFFRQLDDNNKYIMPIDMSKTDGIRGRTGLIWIKTKDFLNSNKEDSTFGWSRVGYSHGPDGVDKTCNDID